MTHDELIRFVRQLADDLVEDYQASDDDIISYIAEAEKEAAERALFFRTDSTYDISISASQASYDLDDLIIFLDRVKISGESKPLTKTTRRELDFEIDAWETATGTPQWYFQEGRTITLYPIPDAAGTLLVDASRYPERAMETPTERHEDLAYWTLYRIYSQRDADINAPQLAELNRQRFIEAFGHKRAYQHDTNIRNLSGHSSMYKHPFQ